MRYEGLESLTPLDGRQMFQKHAGGNFTSLGDWIKEQEMVRMVKIKAITKICKGTQTVECYYRHVLKKHGLCSLSKL